MFATRRFDPAQIFFRDIAEKLVSLYTGRLCQKRYEARLIAIQRGQHGTSCFLVA
jgi:hypothetical protein